MQVSSANAVASASNGFIDIVKNEQIRENSVCVSSSDSRTVAESCIAGVKVKYKPLWIELDRLKQAHDVWRAAIIAQNQPTILTAAGHIIEAYCTLRDLSGGAIPDIPLAGCK